MPISPIVTDPGQATGDRTRLSDNYDTFLILLTAQLQNQDPLAPMDSTQFTQQLVQFSQVEQQIRTNEQLEGLVSQYQAASAGAALSYLGRDALIESGSTLLSGGQAVWGYSLGDGAEEATITIKDSRGRTVFEGPAETAEGSHLFTWNGKNTAGQTMPDGTYTMTVSAEDSAGEDVDVVMTVRETIMGVDFSGATPLVITATGSRDLSTIRAVMDGS